MKTPRDLERGISRRSFLYGSILSLVSLPLAGKLLFAKEPVKEKPQQAGISGRQNIPILMYHDIGYENSRYTVSPELFDCHLNLLHYEGFRSISLDDYVSQNYKDMEKGKKPVVITFDDATEGQFRLIKSGDRYMVDRKSAVGILEDFFERNPDFGLNATFFVDFVNKQNYFKIPFGQKGLEKEKIGYIIDKGMDIGNHTLEHINLKIASLREMANSIEFLNYFVNIVEPNYRIRYLAYPYGEVPVTKEGLDLIRKYFPYALRAWGGWAVDPASPKFNPHLINRIEINNDFKNLFAYVLQSNKLV